MGLINWISKKMDEDISGEKYNPSVAAHREHEQRVVEFEKEFEAAKREHEQCAVEFEKEFEAAKREHKQLAAEIKKRWSEQAYFWEHVRPARIKELKQAFEASGSKYNSAEPDEVEKLLTLTEKKIIQQCRRPKCHGCKLGWICPKYWTE